MPEPSPADVTPPEPPDDPDIREEVRRVQEGHKDAGPSAGVVTDELSEATTQPE